MRLPWILAGLAGTALGIGACSGGESAPVPQVASARATRDVVSGEAKLSSTVEVRFDRAVVLAPLKVPLSSNFEFEVAGLTPVPSTRVAAPAVLESPIHIECRLHRELEIGNSIVVFGEVVFASVDDAVLTNGRIDPMKLAPVGRLGGEDYSLTTTVVKVPRPRVSRSSGEPLG